MNILTIKQASEFLQVSEDILYPMVAKGDVPAGKVRGQWRLIKEDLIDWLRQQYANRPDKSKADPCHTNEPEPLTGGSLSAEYAKVLGLPTAKQRQRSKPN